MIEYTNFLKKIGWRIDHLKTLIIRKLLHQRTEDERLRLSIIRRIRNLGKYYEDGNSDILGYTYHPIPFDWFVNIKSHRNACDDRINAINNELAIQTGDWILDVGANVGYFAFALEKLGAIVEAYELNSETFEIGAALSKLYNKNVLYINKAMSISSLKYLRPKYKAILLLSVFHWIIKREGEEEACLILRELAKRTEYIFFEVPSDHDDAMYKYKKFCSKQLVEKYIKEVLPGAELVHLVQDSKWGGRFLYKIDCNTIN